MAGYDWNETYEKLLHFHRIRTSPVALKYFEDPEAMKAVPDIEIGSRHMSPCMCVGAAARQNRTIGITSDNFELDYCRTIHGFMEKDDRFRSAQPFVGSFYSTSEAARAHNAAVNCVSPATKKGFAVAPLQSGRIPDPDVCALFATPGQLFYILLAYQNTEYKRVDLTFVGESTCSDSWVRTMNTGASGVSVGSYGERAYASQAEDELLLSMTPVDLETTLKGAENLQAAGLVYPVPSLGLYCGEITDVTDPAFAGF